MFLLFFLVWVMLNGRWTVEIALFGVGIAGAMYAFICVFMDFSPAKDWRLVKKLPLALCYVYHLVVEIVKANLAMLPFLFSNETLPEPALVLFNSDLKTDVARAILANSITITPGTITVEQEDNAFCVHCFDKTMGEGLDTSIFVELLKRMEE
ncbi:MAG: Na+/H+ antiporter subunit E [Clostridiales bacterium]|nr:Na+/H+ antiporter subunit E [Clostridiales bacterium]